MYVEKCELNLKFSLALVIVYIKKFVLHWKDLWMLYYKLCSLDHKFPHLLISYRRVWRPPHPWSVIWWNKMMTAMEDPLPVHYWPLSNHGECPPILDSRCEEDNQPPVLRLIGRISASAALLENHWSSLVTILKAVPRPFQGPRWKSCQIRDFTTFNSCSFVLSSVIYHT